MLTGVTGDGDLLADRDPVRAVFTDVLLTDAELALGHWERVDDVMDEWLGSRTG